MEHTPAAPTPSPGSPSGPWSFEILEIDANGSVLSCNVDSETLNRYYTVISSVDNVYNKPRQCIVDNFCLKTSASEPFFKGPKSLFDTGCSVSSGLVFSLQFCKRRKIDFCPKPQGQKSYICKLANGSLIKPNGYVPKICMKIDNNYINFYNIPVFPKLSYDVIIGFSAFIDHNLTIFASNGKVYLTLGHTLLCEGSNGQRRVGRSIGAVGACPPPLKSSLSIFPCSVQGARAPGPLSTSQHASATCSTLVHSNANVYEGGTPSAGLPPSKNEVSREKHFDGYVLGNSIGPTNEKSKVKDSFAVSSPCSEFHDFKIESKVSKGGLPPLGEAELSDGEGDDIVTLEDCFEVETTPGGTLSFEDSSENILELNNVTAAPSDDVAPLKGNKPFVQLIHTDTRIFRSTNNASNFALSSGGHERESTRAGKHALTTDNCLENKDEFNFIGSQLSKPEIASNVGIKKHPFDKKRPLKMKMRRRAKMLSIASSQCGGEAGFVTLPTFRLEPRTIYYLNLPIEGGAEPPAGTNPGFLIPEEQWLSQDIVIPEGIMPRKLRKVRLAICNVGDTDIVLNENNKIEGYITSDSLVNDVRIPFHRNMTLKVNESTSVKDTKQIISKLNSIREILKSDQGRKESTEINAFDAAPNNLNLDISTVKTSNPQSKDISNDAKRQLLVDLGLTDNEVLLEQGGEGFTEEVQDLIMRKAHAFVHPGGPKLGESDFEVELKLKEGCTPPRAKPRPLNPFMLDNLRNQLREWENEGAIEKSTSEIASPLVPVKKKGGEVRWCVDFRQLNSQLEGDQFPLPNIGQLLDQASGHQIYSTLDVSQAFLSVKIAASSRAYTSFVCPEGLYQFCRLPFGLKISPAVYSRFVARALQGLATGNISIYLDDVLLATHTAREHLEKLEQLLDAHIKAGLLLKPSKCKLFKRRIEFLGHLVSKDGIETSPAHTEAIVNWNRPVAGKELASFLGLASYYSQFIPGYSKIAAPLHSLKKQTIITWCDKTIESFETLKNFFKGSLIRVAPDWDNVKSNPLILHTDWSRQAMGWTLSQTINGQERLIHAGGRKCSPGESNYASWKGELCALVSAIKRLDNYLSAHHFIVKTDNTALKWLVNLKSGEGIIFRWSQILSKYDFEVCHIPGKDNIVADILSRSPELFSEKDNQQEMIDDEATFDVLANISPCRPSDVCALVCVCVGECSQRTTASTGGLVDAKITVSNYHTHKDAVEPTDLKVAPDFASFDPGPGLRDILRDDKISHLINDIPKLQQEDPVLKVVGEWLKAGVVPTQAGMGYCLTTYRRIFDQLSYDSHGRMVRNFTNCFGDKKSQILLPYSLFEGLWTVAHMAETAPHPGIQRTVENLRSWVYAPDLNQLVEARIAKCDDCRLRTSNLSLHQGPFSRDYGRFPNDCWSVDVVGKMNEDEGCHYILSCQDLFSRFLFLEPLPDKSARSVAEAIFRIIKVAGLPQRIRTDMGLEFKNALLKRIQRRWNIQVTNSVPFFHQSNMVERVHKELNRGLKFLLPEPPDGWVQAVTPLALAYNSQQNRVTGFSPNLIYFGRESFHPLTLKLQPDDDDYHTVKSPAEHLLKLKQRTDIISEKLYRASQLYLKKMADVYRDHPDQGDIVVGSRVYFVSKFWPKRGVPDRMIYRWAGPGKVTKIDKNYLTIEAQDSKNKTRQITLHISCVRLAVKGDRPLALGEVPIEPEEYTQLILPPFPSPSKEDTSPDVYLEEQTVKDEVETDVNLDVGLLPAPEVPAPLAEAPPAEAPLAEAPAAPPAPVVTRAGREIRPPARYPQTVIIPADYIELIQQC